jgi:hypothetical protein
LDLFEFILIITSVIFALAVAQILSGISRIAQSEAKIETFVPHSIWVFNLFIFIFLIWWASWEFRDNQWTFPQYAYMLIAPTLLFFSCSLLVPQQLEGKEVSMEEHFFRIRRPLFVSYFFAALAVIVDGNLLADEPVWHKGRFGHLAILGLAIWAYFSSNKNAHKIIAIMTMLAFVALITVRFWNPR